MYLCAECISHTFCPIGRMVEKCARYWPEHVGGQESCGQFKVRMAEEKAEEMLGVKKRQLEVVDATVEQVHFTSWKEGEVPASTKQFFRFSAEFADSWRRKGRGRREERRLLVHCSDGGGRTGMFLALLATLLSGGDGSAMEEVLRLRSFRTGMVGGDCLKVVYIEARFVGKKCCFICRSPPGSSIPASTSASASLRSERRFTASPGTDCTLCQRRLRDKKKSQLSQFF